MSQESNLQGMLNQAIAERVDVQEQNPTPEPAEESNLEPQTPVSDRTSRPEHTSLERTSVEQTSLEQASLAQTSLEPKQETNFRALRDKKRELERRNLELERYIEANMPTSGMGKQQSKAEPEEESLPDPDDEGLVDGRQYKALKKEIHRYKQELHTERQERTKALAEMKLLAKYPDVYDVVNRDTMEELMHVSPEEASTILNDPNPYTQHVSAYKAIKRYNIGADEPYLADMAKAKQNMAKPKPAAALATKAANSPLSSVENYYGPMSSDEKAKLRREMDDAINNRYR